MTLPYSTHRENKLLLTLKTENKSLFILTLCYRAHCYTESVIQSPVLQWECVTELSVTLRVSYRSQCYSVTLRVCYRAQCYTECVLQSPVLH